MDLSFSPPRSVSISEAALLARSTPEDIRRYQEAGLFSSPAGDSEDPRYGYDDFIRLLWIEKMAGAGIALDDIRKAFADPAPATADDDAPGRRAGTFDGRLALLSDFVADRLEGLPEGSLRLADLDSLLLSEHTFGPLGAAVQAGRFIALAAHPELREESDRVDAAEEGLDDSVAVDDPRVMQVAAERHAFELALESVIEESGLAESNEALFDSWEALHPAAPDACQRGPEGSMSLVEAVGRMPYDFSPARLRSMELSAELAAQGPSAS